MILAFIRTGRVRAGHSLERPLAFGSLNWANRCYLACLPMIHLISPTSSIADRWLLIFRCHPFRSSSRLVGTTCLLQHGLRYRQTALYERTVTIDSGVPIGFEKFGFVVSGE